MAAILGKTTVWQRVRPWVAVALLFFAAQASSQEDCRSLADFLLKTEHEDGSTVWPRLARSMNGGERPVSAHTIGVFPAQVSPKTRAAMDALEASGGRGIYRRIKYSDGVLLEAVEVDSPPQNGLYGSAFGKIFRELKASGIPVFVDTHMERNVGGHITLAWFSEENSKAAFFVNSRTANLSNKHELQHIKDLVTDSGPLRQEFLELTRPAIHSLERKGAEGVWGEREEQAIKTLFSVLRNLAEIRASEGIVRSVLTRQGLREMVATPTWPREILIYISELNNLSMANGQLLRGLRRLGLSHPHKSAIVFKTVVFGVACPVALIIVVSPISLGIGLTMWYFLDWVH